MNSVNYQKCTEFEPRTGYYFSVHLGITWIFHHHSTGVTAGDSQQCDTDILLVSLLILLFSSFFCGGIREDLFSFRPCGPLLIHCVVIRADYFFPPPPRHNGRCIQYDRSFTDVFVTGSKFEYSSSWFQIWIDFNSLTW